MNHAETPKVHPLARLFSRTHGVFSILFPAFILATFVLSVLGFRFASPYAEAGYVALIYILAVFYLGGLFTAIRIPLWSLVALFAMLALLFLLGIRIYWPLMAALLPAIYRAFSQREKDKAGKGIVIALSALLVMIFVPLSLMSCEAYPQNQLVKKQALSPDGRYAVEICVQQDARLGGRGTACLYSVYPLSLQRQEKTLGAFKWVGVSRIRSTNGAETRTVDWDVRWLDDHIVALGHYRVDVAAGPYIREEGAKEASAFLPLFDYFFYGAPQNAPGLGK